MSPQIATSTPVSRDGLLDFIRPRHQAIIITQRAGGRPQASPVTCGVDGAGRIVVSTYPERAKTRNARRDPQVSVLVLSEDFGGPWVQVDGDAEVIDTSWGPAPPADCGPPRGVTVVLRQRTGIAADQATFSAHDYVDM